MARRSLLMLLAALQAGMLGCSGYRPAALPGTDPDGAADDAGRHAVERGDWVRIVRTDGGVVTGEVVRAVADTVVVTKPGNYGREETAVATSEITALEVRGGTALTTVGLVALSTLTAVVLLAGAASAGGPLIEWGGD